jgi:hypothetical protein
MIHSSIGMLLSGWRSQAWCYLLDDCRHFIELSSIRTVTSACLIDRQVSIDHRWGSAAVTHHSQSYCHMRNRQDMSSDLSFGTNYSHSQSRDTIPLIIRNYFSSSYLMRSYPRGKALLINNENFGHLYKERYKQRVRMYLSWPNYFCPLFLWISVDGMHDSCSFRIKGCHYSDYLCL